MNAPKLYSKNRNLQEKDNIFVLDNYLHLLQWKTQNDTILDVGVGDGTFAVEVLLPRLPKGFGKFVGCDISPEMTEFARKHYGTAHRQFLQFDISAENLPPKCAEAFDHIVSFYTLHWVQKQRQAFLNISKMLKQTGDILLTFLASNPIYDILQIMAKNKRWKSYIKSEYIGPYHHRKSPEKELKHIIEDSGLVCHVCKLESRSYTFPNFDVCRKTVAALSPFLSRMTTEDATQYIEDFVKEIRNLKSITIESVNNNEETINIHYKIFVVHASKSSCK